jgi:hypothetical protein
MDSYKSNNENLQHAMNERHVLPSGENFVVSSNKPTIYEI